MTTTGSLYTLIAPAYLDRAVKAVKAGQWIEAEKYLDLFSKLEPNDHRAPLLRAKIRRRQGRLEECLAELKEARHIGHDPEENDRMENHIFDQDLRRHARIEFRKKIRERCQSLLRAIGRGLHLLCTKIWKLCSNFWGFCRKSWTKLCSKFQSAKNEMNSSETDASTARESTNVDAATDQETESIESDTEELSGGPSTTKACTQNSMSEKLDEQPQEEEPHDGTKQS